ncbi:MAG: hypothetical protein JWM86_1515 [Thermoleophilia bacterium]|nr:hypothetical protein [Thermoleophilia bacterium]
MSMPTILTGAAGRALRTLTPLTKPTGPIEALRIVHRAMPDMASALGADRGRTLGKAMFDASRRGSTHSAAGREQIRLGLDELAGAASDTARRRLVFATALGAGGAVAYAASHRSTGEGEQIWAPGPIGEGVPGFDPKVDPTGVVI